MKYRARHYAEAFVELYHDTPTGKHADLLHRFVFFLNRQGMLRHRAEIISLVRKSLLTREGGKLVRIEFARVPSDDTLHVVARFLSKKDIVETAINPKLIAGMRVTIDGVKELDMSLKHTLDTMFSGFQVL